MALLTRRRPLLRTAAIASGVYSTARRRQDSRRRRSDERARIAGLTKLHDAGLISDEDFAGQLGGR